MEHWVLNGLDLFSGGGGLSEGISDWVRPVAYCENDKFAQAVLMSRMARGELYTAPIWDDVRTLRGDLLPQVDIIAGGFPCSDISVAGTGKGLDGERSGLVFEFIRLIGECKPRFVFMENVPAIVVRGLDRILLELNALGFDAHWTIVSAAEMGAIHIRKRWFVLAYAYSERLREECEQEIRHDHPKRTRSIFTYDSRSSRRTAGTSERITKPRVDRTGDGMANNVNRHRILGNAVVPIQAREAFKRLIGFK